MLAQLFNPTEIKKNGPATMPAIAPARRTALPFRAAPAVLPATSQSYGDARVIVNGDQRRSTMNGLSPSTPRPASSSRPTTPVLGVALISTPDYVEPARRQSERLRRW